MQGAGGKKTARKPLGRQKGPETFGNRFNFLDLTYDFNIDSVVVSLKLRCFERRANGLGMSRGASFAPSAPCPCYAVFLFWTSSSPVSTGPRADVVIPLEHVLRIVLRFGAPGQAWLIS